MAATLTTRKLQLPAVNLSDIPELMPGAQPSATPSQRTDFEQCCLRLYADGLKEQHGVAAVAANDITVDELEAMFPTLEPTLVHALVADAGTPQRAVDMLLVLTASAAEPTILPPTPRDLALEDIDVFPSLVDHDGWQIPSQHLFDRSIDADLGSAWCDRARAVADQAAPHMAVGKAASKLPPAKKRGSKQREPKSTELVHPEGEYELRHRLGKQRITNRARFRVGSRVTSMSIDAASEFRATSRADETDEAFQSGEEEDM